MKPMVESLELGVDGVVQNPLNIKLHIFCKIKQN